MTPAKGSFEANQAYLQKITGSPEGYTTAEVLALRRWKYPGMYRVSRVCEWRFAGHGKCKLWSKADVDQYLRDYLAGFQCPPGWVTVKKAKEILHISDSALSIRAKELGWVRRKEPGLPLLYRWHEVDLLAQSRRAAGRI